MNNDEEEIFPQITFEDLQWVFLSIGREVLGKTDPGNIFPWAEYPTPQELFGKEWSDLGLLPAQQADIIAKVCRFLGLEATQRPLLEHASLASGPLETLNSVWNEWQNSPRKLNFVSSGSTLAPRDNYRTARMALEEAFHVAKLLPKCQNIISVVPLHHSYGFHMALLQGHFRHSKLYFLQPLPTVLWHSLQPETLVMGFPFFWESLARHGKQLPAKCRPVHCLSSTAPCPPGLEESLIKLGFASFSEIYGSSETGAVGLRQNSTVFKLLPHWKKLKRPGSNLPGLQYTPKHYPAFADDTLQHEFPDNVQWLNANAFKVKGRIDKAVQVAGVNVYPDKIALKICEHKGVASCKVRLMRPDEGNRLKAFIVPDEDSASDISILRQELKGFCKKLLPPERPASFTFGAELPRSSMGKLIDW